MAQQDEEQEFSLIQQPGWQLGPNQIKTVTPNQYSGNETCSSFITGDYMIYGKGEKPQVQVWNTALQSFQSINQFIVLAEGHDKKEAQTISDTKYKSRHQLKQTEPSMSRDYNQGASTTIQSVFQIQTSESPLQFMAILSNSFFLIFLAAQVKRTIL